MRKTWDEQQGPRAPGWMVTYGDIMTLLLTFFILLLSFSSIQESKFKEAIGSLQLALGVLNNPRMVIKSTPLEIPKPFDLERDQVNIQVSKIREYLEKAGIAGEVKLFPTKEGYAIRLSSPLLFDSGSAGLKEGASDVLEKLTSIISAFDNTLRIEGHTDNVPIHNPTYPSNWELSTARALSVLKFMSSRGIEAKRLAAAGYGEFKPIAPNDTEKNRELNRRVEIYVNYTMREKPKELDWILGEDNNGR